MTEAAIDEFFGMIQGINSSLKKIADILTVITITYQENTPPQGEWLKYDEEANKWECSVCRKVCQLKQGTPTDCGMKYCSQCGARMK